ncbi:MAG: AAA family ATPase, partial [Planctomycetota bacterium]
GFKSFADKTRFEFPPGITVVVGPNGSGKSNIVDAIKWVLGEQSAKSLRGKEMADVIFKGAGGPNGRKPANSATATIVLDNTDRRFAFDADEVLVSRRVYRSGEAEYLINNETCRLKDIRNMFRGTGIGTDAYSLIEQGKVDRLLQASAKDRRAIFEEAAGISRFKAKKIEAQRRLARVEGNLIRLSDIVEEVGSRYRSIKNQAAKAARYKEYSSRLQELRTFVGLKDWRQIKEKLTKIESEHSQWSVRKNELKDSVSLIEKDADEVEKQLDSLGQQVNDQQQAALAFRESITEQKSRLNLNQTRIADLESRKNEIESSLLRLNSRYEEIETRNQAIDGEVSTALELCEQSKVESNNLISEISTLEKQIDANQADQQAATSRKTELATSIGERGRLVSSLESQIQSSESYLQQLNVEIENLAGALKDRKSKLDQFDSQKKQLEVDAETKNSDLANAKSSASDAKRERLQLEKSLTENEKTLTGKTQRQKVLMELENRLEGVNAGAKQLLAESKKNQPGPYQEIIGVVADMLTVNVQHAAIVDVALGNAAQYIVVDGEDLMEQIVRERIKVKGRVGLIQLNDPPTLGADPNVSINGEPGVIGRADRLVQVQPEFARFVRALLGGTWIVKSLQDALSIYQRKLGLVRMVTLDGEIVEADGSVIIGPKVVMTGLVSRRSELRLLTKEIESLSKTVDEQAEQVKTAQQQTATLDGFVQ